MPLLEPDKDCLIAGRAIEPTLVGNNASSMKGREKLPYVRNLPQMGNEKPDISDFSVVAVSRLPTGHYGNLRSSVMLSNNLLLAMHRRDALQNQGQTNPSAQSRFIFCVAELVIGWSI